MPKTIKEFQLNQSTGEVSVEYSDDSTSKFNAADMVTAQTDAVTGRIVNSTSGKAALADTQYMQLVMNQGDADAAKSAAIQQAAYSDNAAFVETWSNLSNWTTGGANGVQVSGGALYAGSSPGGGTSGNNHSFSVGSTESFRAVFNVTKLSGATNGGIIVGVSADTAGGTPTAGAGKARGLYISQDTWVYSWDQGAQTNISANPVAGDYVVTVAADENYLSAVATKTDGTAEYRTRWSRSGYNINNLYVFNTDSRALSGSKIGYVGAKKTFSTLAPRAGLEGNGQSVVWSGDGTNNFRLALPPSYDSRIPAPLAICFHGAGSSETTWGSGGDANYPLIAKALTDAGYIVLSAAASNLNGWGAATPIDAYRAAYAWVKKRVAFSSVVVVANSMGGIESLNTISKGLIPGVCAWVGTSPTYSLATAYSNASFTGNIKSAYGIASDGSDYAAKTAGYDPALLPGNAFGAIPMMILAASDDAVIPAAQNGNLLAANVAGISREVVNVSGITGGHTFSVSPYLSQIVAFLNKYAS